MKKVHLDSSIIDGLSSISSDNDSAGGSPQQGDSESVTPDPKYVLISLFSKNPEEEEEIRDSKTIPNPTIYKMRELLPSNELSEPELYTEHVLNLVLSHLKKYGTVQEIRFTGHGLPGKMGNSKNQPFVIGWFLDELAHFEHLHGKIANRIVFDGCNTFSNLNDYAVTYYSNYAQTNHTQLVGATSTTVGVVNMLGAHFNVGRYAQFSPTGKIIRDELDTRYNPEMLSLDNDKSWTDFYIGHTAKEGADIKKRYEEQQKSELKQLDWLIKNERSKF